MESNKVIDNYDRFGLPVYPRGSGVVLQRGEGSFLFDLDGKSYLDFCCGIGVTNLGHRHAQLVAEAHAQIDELWHSSNQFFNIWHGNLIRALAERSGLSRVFLTNSGAEANETAIKIARKWGNEHAGGKFEIITFTDGFHGRSLGTISASGKKKIQEGFQPLLPGFVPLPNFDMNSIKEAANERTVAVLMELAIGGEGVILPPKGFVEEVRSFTRSKGILLIVDEMQSGIGRTGGLFGFQGFEIQPDIVTLAKGLAGGLPIGATLCTDSLADVLTTGTHGTTFGGNPLSARVGCKVLEIVGDDKTLQNVRSRATQLMEGLDLLKQRFPNLLSEVRGIGLMVGITINVTPGDLLTRLAKHGLLCVTAGKDSIRIYPPLNVSSEEISKGLLIFEDVFKELE